jgi:hypothetical protein
MLIRKLNRLKYQNNHLDNKLDWLEFCSKLKIRSGGSITNFIPYSYQIDIVNAIKSGNTIIAKSRQLGVSETVCSYLLWRAYTEPGYLAVIFSRTQTDSSLLARRVNRMLQGAGLTTKTDNLRDIELEIGGRLLFKNSSPDCGRGLESVCDVFFDEYAFLDNDKHVYAAVIPSQQMVVDSRLIIVSTPNGTNNHFFDLLNEGNSVPLDVQLSKTESEPYIQWKDDGNWNKILLHWKIHPIYGSDCNFLENIRKKRKLTTDKIKQEYCINFNTVTESYFPSEIIQKNIEDIETGYIKGIAYCGIDPSGQGKDYTVAVIGVVSDDKIYIDQIYRKQKTTFQISCFEIGNLLNQRDCFNVGIEKNGIGVVWLEELSKKLDLVNFHGIETTGSSKPVMLARVKFLLENERLKLPNYKLLVNEFLSFTTESLNNETDDMVMAIAMLIECVNFNLWNY